MPDLTANLNTTLEGRYRIERQIGEGGMAKVFLAADLRHHRKVALKVFEARMGAAVDAERFEREIETIAGIHHPHILPLHDSGHADGLIYFVMPFVEEGTLRDRLRREGPLPVEEALRIAKEVAEALAYAHRQGVVHRDIKPGNIMLDSGHAVVSDFGIALLTSGLPGDRITGTGPSPGTPAYMSPEQVRGSGPIDDRSDIYSLGCVLYEMLTGDPPFTGSNPQAVVSRKLVDTVPPIRSVRGGLPEAVERLTLEALERVPADRPRSTAEFAERLGRLESEVRSKEADAEVLGFGPATLRSPGRLATLVAIWLAGGALLLTGIGMLSTRVFDQKIQMPPMYAPSRSDYLVVGAQAVIPFVVWGSLGLGAWFLMTRYILPLTGEGISRITTGVNRNGAGRLRRALERIARSWPEQSLADLFLLAMVMGSIAVITLPPVGDLYAALLSTGSEALGCASRSLHALHAAGLSALVVGFGVARYGLFRWLGNRGVSRRSWAIARWASAVWLVVLVVIVTLPWRVLWDSSYERARIGGEPAYVILEDEERILAFTPSSQSARPYLRDEVEISRLGVVGYLFEEPEVFESELPRCESTWESVP